MRVQFKKKKRPTDVHYEQLIRVVDSKILFKLKKNASYVIGLFYLKCFIISNASSFFQEAGREIFEFS